MQEVIINKKKLKVTIDGKEFFMDFPTRKHTKVFNTIMENQDLNAVFTLLEELGLPTEAVDEIDIQDAFNIFQAMIQGKVKKNS
jgi:hypothetical protein